MTRSRCFALSVCLGWLLFSPADTQSCYTCPEFEFSILTVAGRDLIFSGRVLKVTPHPQTGRVHSSIGPQPDYLFAVTEVWKGEVTDTVTVHGGGFQKDQIYLVFASKGKNGFYVGVCDEWPLLAKASTYLTLLNSLPVQGTAKSVDRAIIQSFVALTHSQSESTCVAAAETLGYIAKEPDLTLPALLDLYHHGQSKERAAAVGALASCYDKPISLSFLKTVYQDQDPGVRAKALFTLSRIAPSAEGWYSEGWSGLDDPAPEVRAAAIRALPRKTLEHDRVIAHLLEAIVDSSAGVRAASASMMGVFKCAVECEPALLRAALDPNRDVSLSAMYSLYEMNKFYACDERCDTALVEAVSDSNPYLAEAAFMLLVSVGIEEDIQRIVPVAMSNPNPKCRKRVLQSLLWHYEGPEAFRICIRALSDSSPPVRELALGQLENAMFRCLPSDPPVWIPDDVRQDVIPALIANAHKGQPDEIRESALEVLVRLSPFKEGPNVFREAVEEDEDNEDIWMLGRQGLINNGIDPDAEPR